MKERQGCSLNGTLLLAQPLHLRHAPQSQTCNQTALAESENFLLQPGQSQILLDNQYITPALTSGPACWHTWGLIDGP